MDYLPIKRQLYQYCQAQLKERIERTRAAYQDAQEAANEEIKSSAGDKYETGRSMMLQEMDKHGQYLSETLKLKNALDQMDVYDKSNIISQGSLVVTNNGVFYLAISMGSVKIEGKQYFVISPASPIGSKLMDMQAGGSFELNGRNFTIAEVF